MKGPGSSADYEGLVKRTAAMFHGRAGLEFEDCAQELRVTVLKALAAYDPARCRSSCDGFVFSAVTNRVKDMKRDAVRRVNAPLDLSYIEDLRDPLTHELHWFEAHFALSSHEQVFGGVDGAFLMPAGITDGEREIILLLVVGHSQTEIATLLCVQRWSISASVARIREKLADFKPSAAEEEPTPTLHALPVVAADQRAQVAA